MDTYELAVDPALVPLLLVRSRFASSSELWRRSWYSAFSARLPKTEPSWIRK